MRALLHYIFIGTLLLLMSCSDKAIQADAENTEQVNRIISEKLKQKQLKYSDIISLWKNEMGQQLNRNKTIDGFSFTASYKPYTIMALEENEASVNQDDTITPDFIKKSSVYSNMHFFNFYIENKSFKPELIKYGVENNQQYYDRITYYSFNCRKDIYVVEDKDTLPCSFVNFERTFDVKPGITLNMAFTRKSTSANIKTLKFVFEDSIFNKGKLIFDFNTKPLQLLNYLKPLDNL